MLGDFLPGRFQKRSKFFHFPLLLCTGGEIRTPINGFGDRYSTLELHPYIVQPFISGCKDTIYL